MPFSRLQIAFKAARQLGPTQVALNALYRFGLLTGHYRRVTGQRNLGSQPQALRPLFELPTRENLLSVLGQAGLQDLCAAADEIVSGRYRQFGGDPVEIQLAPPEPLTHWTEYETHHLSPASDIKFIWEPARFGWAFTLGRAYHLTGAETYAAAFWRWFETFSAANPPGWGPNWISGQEVGLRLMALVWAGQVFAAAQTSSPERLSQLAQSIAFHALRIPPTLPYARSQNNNHLLTEAAALYTASLALPGHPEAAKWGQTGQKWLLWCFKHQIDTYGEYVQHSTNYHRLMLQTALWVAGINAQGSGNPLTPEARENLARAAYWLLSLLDPESGGVPNLGANDGALIFPLANGSFQDFRPAAQAAARAFLKTSLPSGPWDEMALWFGLPREQDQLEIPRYPGDGQLYAEHSWGYLRAVRYTSRPSHADQLHFDLWWRGLNLAQDAGTYLYNAEPPWDNRLTSTLVHNTISLDGREQMTRVSRFLYLDWTAAASKQHFETGGAYLQRKSARTEAAAKLGVHHERTVTVFEDERWLVTDELLNPGQKDHIYRLHWLLPDWEWELENREAGLELRLKSPLGWVKLAVLAEQPVLGISLVRAGELIKLSGFSSAEISPTRGWVSPTYAAKIPALSLAVEVQSTGNVNFSSEFSFPAP